MAEGGARDKHARRRATSGNTPDAQTQQRLKGDAHAGKIRSAAASTIAAVALLAGLGFASPAQAQDKPPIKIGFLPPITGPLASPGAEMVNGFRLFWEQAGMTAGGRKDRDRQRRYDLQPGSGADAGAPPRAAGEGCIFLVGPLCGHEGSRGSRR